ncbi:dipeptide/oligopeptide/nickel ABC transporter permease/ATP-binding protein [Arthrobacter sp. OV608]|uniref:dipeptide/oligopeptide/nickel ABC transporter permease/ATP-binding protein n=1 Tax=Arthrobacter sp. OV608 TaxID=1882768 RepID=UPI0008B15E88|nr:dipeptide/oligopeptide/nickel ABC transporter permease/ATP-binding protein [Arthrobacter sp. OV608]SER13421.1 peptide/nickel transport system permease protein [Arthrobacter sp. OV608]
MSAVIEGAAIQEQSRRAAERGAGFLPRLVRQPIAVACSLVLLVIVLACVFAEWVSPYGPLDQDLQNTAAGPSASHLLGTDQLGRDILSRMLHGGQVTLLGIVQAVVVCAVIGLFLGLTAGTLGGWVETVAMRLCDLLLAVPGLVMLLVILGIYGNNEAAAMITLGVIMAPTLARVVYSATIAVREELYVASARVAGLTSFQIMRRHILSGVTGPALTQISIVAAVACIAEAGIGYLGLGVAPPAPSWGNLVTDAQNLMPISAWMLVPTGGIIAVVTLSLTLLGNGIRDAYMGRSSGSSKAFSWRALAVKVSQAASPAGGGAAPLGQESILSVKGMTVRLPRGSSEVTIVDDVNFHVAPGEAVAIVGESGCGKSMTISGVLRVLPMGAHVAAASISFKGAELTSLSEREMNAYRGTGIGFISQEPISSLNPAFTVGHQLEEAVRLHRGVGKGKARQIARELMARVRLPEPDAVAKKYPHELSGGMAQRIAIARALAGEPDLLIADEPTTALDVSVQCEILDLLRDLREQTGMALILVTHDWGVVAEACDRALVMYAGQVVESADVRSIIAHPAHPYTRALLQSSSVGIAPRQLLPVIAGTVPVPGSWPHGCRFASRCVLAEDACRTGPIPMVTLDEGSAARCIRTDVDELVRT